ncbi:MAG TPA: helix-turn-helix domain-containing protein [Candidatus Blautia merdavium]|uniref:Helix-turn-helix domain-containing protein n=1 Tax=Candidatus Blautia merdavium TaxID=2838494 RepID=A0A9D2PPA7_9FIRM|nr:helix-turn-helix domain-containing protein [Candidatus Blautia merdavium]
MTALSNCNGKHLTLSDRIAIETGIENGDSFTTFGDRFLRFQAFSLVPLSSWLYILFSFPYSLFTVLCWVIPDNVRFYRQF